MKEALVKYNPQFGQILLYFKADFLEKNSSYVIYSVEAKKNIYTVYFYKDAENNIKAFCYETLTGFEPSSLLYFLAESNEFKSIKIILDEVIKIEEYDNFSEIQNQLTEREITNQALQLVELKAHDDFNSPYINKNVLLEHPFKQRVLLRQGKICFPLSINRKIVNLSFIDDELNGNSGSFTSFLLSSSRSIALFFSGKDLLEHADKKIASEYFYILFSKNINPIMIEKLNDFSREKNLPINIYLNSINNCQLLSFLQIILCMDGLPFDNILLESNEMKFTFHFVVRNQPEKILPLVEFVNVLNRRLMKFFNNEIPVTDEDVSIYLDLINTDSSKDQSNARNSITFAVSPGSICAVLNEMMTSLKINLIAFKTL